MSPTAIPLVNLWRCWLFSPLVHKHQMKEGLGSCHGDNLFPMIPTVSHIQRTVRKTAQNISITVIKITRLWDSLIFLMGIPILVRLHVYILNSSPPPSYLLHVWIYHERNILLEYIKSYMTESFEMYRCNPVSRLIYLVALLRFLIMNFHLSTLSYLILVLSRDANQRTSCQFCYIELNPLFKTFT